MAHAMHVHVCASRSDDLDFHNPTGPGDIGESEGMGGLLAVAHQSHGQAEDDDIEERAEREQNIKEGGDRSDAELVAIDAFKAEMEKCDAANCDLENNAATSRIPEEDWRNDVKIAEELYVQDPTKVDDDFLERMRVKYLSKQAKKEKLAELAHKLVDRRITAIPAQVLLDSDPCSRTSLAGSFSLQLTWTGFDRSGRARHLP